MFFFLKKGVKKTKRVSRCPMKFASDCVFKEERAVWAVLFTAHAPEVAAADSSSSSDSATQGNGRKLGCFKPWRRNKRCLSQRRTESK